MSDFLQLLIAGLATGGIYALVAIGFTLLWQTSQTINFAQGEFVMLPAFFILIAMGRFGLSFWPAVAAFKDKFNARFKYVPDHNGVKGYTGVYAVAYVTKKLGKFDRKALLESLRAEAEAKA